MKKNEADKLKIFLGHTLKEPLPGHAAQMKMAPKFDTSVARTFNPADDARSSAVLVLITPDENGKARLLLTLRSVHLKNHGGQISFPGGKADEGETPEETAIREAYEETSLKPESVELIGRLSELYVPPSNASIVPIVAFADNCDELEANPDEVSEILFVNLEHILGDDKILYFESSFGSKMVKYPYWDIHPTTKLWGATAIIISELLEIYSWFKSSE